MAVQILDSSYMQTTQPSKQPSTYLDFCKMFVVNGPLRVTEATQNVLSLTWKKHSHRCRSQNWVFCSQTICSQTGQQYKKWYGTETIPRTLASWLSSGNDLHPSKLMAISTNNLKQIKQSKMEQQ